MEATLAPLRMEGGELTATPSLGPDSSLRISVIVPVLDAIRHLPRTIPPMLAAAANTDRIELIYVDNGSTDGSFEYLMSNVTKGIRVEHFEDGISAATRNFGARRSGGEFLSFLDADCIIATHYFIHALAVLQSTGAAATGCEVEIPLSPGWIEATWHDLHYLGREREVHYLNSGNFFISRKAFEDVGGFREDLPSGADAEMGQRLTRAGYRIYESPSVGAIHLGNPQTTREFYRRSVWHALGMFGTVQWREIDKPTAMMALHFLAMILGLGLLFEDRLGLATRVVIALALQLAVPVLTVGYRVRQTRRGSRFIKATILYWLYYLARLNALALVVGGRSAIYAKSRWARGSGTHIKAGGVDE